MTILDASPISAVSAGADLPSALDASVERHRRNLAALIANLRVAGFDEDMIENSVRLLVESYGIELTAAIRALVEDPTHAE